MRRGLASFGGDVRDDADLALELLEIHGVTLNISTDEVVERAVVRALCVLAVNEAHGCGEEAAVAHDVCRPEHAALTTACELRGSRVARALMAFVSVFLERAVLSLPQTRLLAPQLSNLRYQQSVSSLSTFLATPVSCDAAQQAHTELAWAEVCFCSRALLL